MRPKAGAFSRFRPRVLTLIVLFVVAAPTVLANFTPSDATWVVGYTPQPDFDYGWPFIWYWRNYVTKVGGSGLETQVVRYSWPRLAGNLAIWLVMLAAVGTSCEWLVRRYRPRLRWSLKSMLAAVGIFAVFCMWCVSLRDWANDQDRLIAAIRAQADGHLNRDGELYGNVCFEHKGPKWLDLLGANRYTRRIVGVLLNHDDDVDELLKRIGRLPDLRYLDLHLQKWTPGIAATLGEMRQLQTFRIEKKTRTFPFWKPSSADAFDERNSDEIFGTIGKLKQLKVLTVSDVMFTNECLQHLAALTGLKSLRLEIPWTGEDGLELEHLASIGTRPTLAHLPLLPRLEAVGFHGGSVGVLDLRQLAAMTSLKAIDLTKAFITDTALAELASLESLEELVIENGKTSAAGLESLLAIKGLKALHIGREMDFSSLYIAHDSVSDMDDPDSDTDDPDSDDDDPDSDDDDPNRDVFNRLTHWLPLDNGTRLYVQKSDIERYHQTLEALRQSNPGIWIDDVTQTFDQRRIWHSELSQFFLLRWPGG